MARQAGEAVLRVTLARPETRNAFVPTATFVAKHVDDIIDGVEVHIPADDRRMTVRRNPVIGATEYLGIVGTDLSRPFDPRDVLARIVARIDACKDELLGAGDVSAWADGLADDDPLAEREREFARGAEPKEEFSRWLATRGKVARGVWAATFSSSRLGAAAAGRYRLATAWSSATPKRA